MVTGWPTRRPSLGSRTSTVITGSDPVTSKLSEFETASLNLSSAANVAVTDAVPSTFGVNSASKYPSSSVVAVNSTVVLSE